MRKSLFAAAFALLATASPLRASGEGLSLAPVPYTLTLPQAVGRHLSTGPLTGAFAEEVQQAGATAATLVFYQPENGEKTILMSVYYVPAGKFDAAQKPDEPPMFGQEVLRSEGMVLSVAGPLDTIYEPGTPDGENVIAANSLIYAPQSYTPK